MRIRLILVPEGRRLFPRLTVEQNLMLGAFACSGASRRDETLEYAFETFPVLHERRHQQAGMLVGRRAADARHRSGLMSDPHLLMLDEPSCGVAPKLVARIFETIALISRRGISILLVEQNVGRALDVATRGYVIQTGRVVLQGIGRDLLGNDMVKTGLPWHLDLLSKSGMSQRNLQGRVSALGQERPSAYMPTTTWLGLCSGISERKDQAWDRADQWTSRLFSG